MFGRLLRWLKKGKAAAPSPNPFPDDDPRHEAFEALWSYAQSRGKRRRRAPTSELKELVLEETPDDMPLPSRDLLKQYREQWRGVPPDEWRRLIHRLPKARGSAKQEADWASAQHRDRMRRRGKKAPPHYYGVGERTGTGEVDRTYDTARPEETIDGLGDDDSK